MTNFLPQYPKNLSCRLRALLPLALSAMLIFACLSPTYGQKIFGVATEAGPKGGGTVFSLDPSGDAFMVEHAFELPVGLPNSLLVGQDGHYYGVTSGGHADQGTISRISADGTEKTVLHHFEGGAQGGNPLPLLVQDEEGYIYGTAQGGNEDSGLIFRISPGGEYTILHHFDDSSPSGGTPSAGLLLHSDGKLYGQTSSSLDGMGYGAIYSIERDGTGFTVLRTFDNLSQGSPVSALSESQDGLLYGFADYGPDSYGFIYRIATDGSQYEIIHSLDPEREGHSPHLPPLLDSNGFLYGMTTQLGQGGQGTIFRLDIEDKELEVLLAHADYPTTSFRVSRNVLLLGSDGGLYGLASSTSDNSEIFRLDPESRQITTVSDLETESGFIRANNIGTLDTGEIIGVGTIGQEIAELIFTLNLDGSALAILYDQQTHSPSVPISRLFESSTGQLIGTTMRGGTGSGTIFSINPDGSGFMVLRNLNFSQDGGQPYGGVIEGSDGDFYGMTSAGGAHEGGTIYRMSPDGTEFTVLRHLSETDGTGPNGELVEGPDGLLYGVAPQEGPEGYGSLFRISKSGDFEVIEDFSSADNGRNPNGSLTIGSDGRLYGFTTEGGSFDKGTIFSVDFNGNDFRVLYETPFRDQGMYPVDRLLEGEPGVFYGVMVTGPDDFYSFIDFGLVFKLTVESLDFEILQEFVVEEDGVPYSGLAMDEQGNLYGGTEINFSPFDPETQAGVIFKLSAGDYEYEVLHRMNAPRDGKDVRALTILEGKIPDCPPLGIDSIIVDSGHLIPAGSEFTAHVPLPEDHNWIAAVWHWGDGETSEASFTDTTAVGSHSYAQAGSYTITLAVTDDCGTSTSPPAEVEVTDEAQPSTGSVKGTGMFSSPRGAYADKPQMKGMAHYSISAKAEDGGVSGTFQFHIADLQFRSSQLDRLIVEGNKAWLYGEGKIKGKGRYGFMVAAVDEEGRSHKGKSKHSTKDRLRVKIWDLRKGDRLVYDNQQGDPNDAVARQEIDRGTIIILGEDTGSESNQDLILDQLKKVKAFPNPVRDRVTLDLGDISPDQIHTLLTDAYGHIEIRDRHRKLDGNLIEFDLTHLRQGTYYIRIETREGHRTIKILKK